MDDVPEINVSREACGHPSRPHRVRSSSRMVCLDCNEDLSATLRARAVAALGPKATEEDNTGG